MSLQSKCARGSLLFFLSRPKSPHSRRISLPTTRCSHRLLIMWRFHHVDSACMVRYPWFSIISKAKDTLKLISSKKTEYVWAVKVIRLESSEKVWVSVSGDDPNEGHLSQDRILVWLPEVQLWRLMGKPFQHCKPFQSHQTFILDTPRRSLSLKCGSFLSAHRKQGWAMISQEKAIWSLEIFD